MGSSLYLFVPWLRLLSGLLSLCPLSPPLHTLHTLKSVGLPACASAASMLSLSLNKHPGRTFYGQYLPFSGSCQTNAGRGPLCGLAPHPVALGTPIALSSACREGSPWPRHLPFLHLSLSEILRMSFCPFHACPGLSGLFKKHPALTLCTTHLDG